MKSSLISTLCLSAFHLPGMAVAELTDGNLQQPKSFSSNEDSLEINLNLVEREHETVAASKFNTRLLGGTLPGPTVRVKPGQMLYVNFKNKLKEQEGTNTAENDFAFPDSTNLHWHGPHVSSGRPGDDTTLIVNPGESFRYEVQFPSDHMGGTHWLHPHRHGSGTRQVGGGAASVVIVEDEPGDVPPEVEDAKERVMMVQLIDTQLNDLLDGDQLFDLDLNPEVDDEFLLVNGQYNPTVKLRAGEWQRWRIVFGAWNKTPLNFNILDAKDDCEMNLLAKDGIYVDDYPREVDFYPIPTGGRADIMIRCKTPGSYPAKSYAGTLFTLKVFKDGEIDVSTPPTQNWNNFPKPSYLTDLRNTEASPGCKCDTVMDSDQLNGLSYDKDVFLHTIALGSVVERNVTGVVRHPYHQHVYPFQIQEFYGTPDSLDAAYFKVGDYHDSISLYSQDSVLIRYEASNFKGRIAVHCHRLTHAEKGMLSAELVVDPEEGGVCSCSPTDGNGGFTAAPTPAPTPSKNCKDKDRNFKLKDSGKKTNCKKTSNLEGKKLNKRCKKVTEDDKKVKDICKETCGRNGQGKCSFLADDEASRQSNNIFV